MRKMLKKVAYRYVNSLARALSGGQEEENGHGRYKKNPLLQKEHSMVVNRLPGYFLIFCILGVLYLLYIVMEPFLTTLIVAAVLTILFYGVYKAILGRFRKFKRFASLVTCLLIIFIIVIPLSAFIVMLAKEAIDMYQTVSVKIASGSLDSLLKWETGGWIFDVKQKLFPFINIDALEIKKMILTAAQGVSTFLVEQSATFVKNLGGLAISFVVMLFSMYYLFKDGDALVNKLTILSPLPKKYEDQIIVRLKETVKAIAIGVFFTAIIQGIVAGIGYTVAGISNPVFWGAATAFFSLIPLVGTAAIWVPAAIISFLLGNHAGGIFLFLWGIFLVGTVDNLVRPFLIGGRSHTYPLLTFFVVLGGIVVFGLKGLIFGPLILVLLLTLLHVYELEYKNVLDK